MSSTCIDCARSETKGAISDVTISKGDYRDIVNASFKEGLIGRQRLSQLA